MKIAMRWLLTGVFITLCVVAWMGDADRNVVGAQGPAKPAAVIKRIYTGTDGLSHVEELPIDAKTVLEKVTGAEVRVSEPRFSDWHPGPQRQYIINLAGHGELEVAEGKVDLPPGSIEFIDDLTGKGHTTRVLDKGTRVSIWLKFEDQKQRVGPLLPQKPGTSAR